MNFYAFHIGDYASATRHLSWIEDAAYRRLIDLYYVRGEPLPLDLRQVYRLVVASSDEHREAVDVVLSEFFNATDSGYQHNRCDAEISAAQDKKDKASIAAQIKWRNAKDKEAALLRQNSSNAQTIQPESDGNADAMRTHQISDADASKEACECYAPNPNPNPNPKSKPTPPATPTGFAEFWLAYPKKVGKGDAEKKWKQLKPDLAVCLSALAPLVNSHDWKKQGGQFIPNPATWLSQKRWEDEGTEVFEDEEDIFAGALGYVPPLSPKPKPKQPDSIFAGALGYEG